MGLASKLPALQADLAAISGGVTYRQLADQLKVAIAYAQQNGLAAVSIQTATGTAITYPTLNVAALALAQFEELATASGEVVPIAIARMKLA